ncbi:hypothetical protein K5X82_01805 [Halosquirtibacter xylanolyticus]|uniref:hypothetical protein n=1 Tax=Halosquirtibacter xylanolyticus TaxID=3374599 RepID=UPI00374812EE|nr:hypothetical protein K5X82_01805 [Prolixibacteraceae bacterium]
MKTDRVYFYSVHDGACYKNIELAEKVLNNFSEDNEYNINDIIELYQVKQYIDNEVFLKKWTEQDIQEIKDKVKTICSIIVKFWNKITSNNLIELFDQLECWTLQDSFWRLTSNLSAFKRISKDSFSNLIQQENCNISSILHQEKIVKHYGTVIRDFLISYDKSAGFLLSQFVQRHDRDRNNYFFPKSLSLTDREDIISKYLEKSDANLNYVCLALNIKKSDNLAISDRTRLKAKRLERKLNQEILDKNGGTLFGIQIGFREDQTEPFKAKKDGNKNIYTYSAKYIFEKDIPILYLRHFIGLFGYLDRQMCISMVSKDLELGPFEKISMKSRSEYPVGNVFLRKEALSFYQIFLYDRILQQNQKQNIEQLIHFYISDHLNSCFGLKDFRFNIPSEGTNYSERIRTLLAEYDALLRQYKLFKEDGEIDPELLSISSSAINISQIPSFVSKKYCYLKKDKLTFPIQLLFSDRTTLSYVEPFKDCHYHCLYDLIIKEEVLYGNYESYQRDMLYHLFECRFLFVDHNGYIRIRDKNELFVLKQLYKEETLNYWLYPEEYKVIIDKMVDNGLLEFEDTLFNKFEQSYFNYYLNKKEFTNGIDLRNSFMHGTNPTSDSELINLYYVLLRIIVLTILKIDDDQSIKKQIMNNNPNR